MAKISQVPLSSGTGPINSAILDTPLRPLGVPVDTKTMSKEELADHLRKERVRDAELVKGIFHLHEAPGGSLSFCYRKYKGEPIRRYDLNDGQICELPLGVAKYLNKSGLYPVHCYKRNEQGMLSQQIGKNVRRYSFTSLQFIDVGDPATNGEEFVVEPGRLAL